MKGAKVAPCSTTASSPWDLMPARLCFKRHVAKCRK